MNFFKALTEIFKSLDTSRKIGEAFKYRIGFIVAIYVIVGTITSSFSLTLDILSDMCKADVPFTVGTT